MLAHRTFLGLSIASAFISVVLLTISLASNHWEQYEFSHDCLLTKNSTDTLVEFNDDYYSVTIHNKEAENAEILVYNLHNKYAGVWSLCNDISGILLVAMFCLLSNVYLSSLSGSSMSQLSGN